MRCQTCGNKAVITMHQHRLSLCRDHYLEWLPAQVLKSITKFQMASKNDKILLAVSGGKDSLALWDILHGLGFMVDGLYIDLGIDHATKYSARSGEHASQFANRHGLRLITISLLRDYGQTISEMANRSNRGRGKPCSTCGLVKRHIFNRIARDEKYDVIATAHNLDDEVSILLANTLDWSLAHLSRGQPVLPSSAGFIKKMKPFCRIYERESAAWAVLRGIKFMPDECPFSKGNKQLFFKTYLNEWEENAPGTKLRFYNNYLKALNDGAFPTRQETCAEMLDKLCGNCGQPTTTGGLCAFCILLKDNLVEKS